MSGRLGTGSQRVQRMSTRSLDLRRSRHQHATQCGGSLVQDLSLSGLSDDGRLHDRLRSLPNGCAVVGPVVGIVTATRSSGSHRAHRVAVPLMPLPVVRLGSMTPHTPLCFFAAPRKPQHVSDTHVTQAGNTRLSLSPRLGDGGCNMLVDRGSAKHCLPVLEPQNIPLEHTGRTLLILGRAISMEERILEPFRFGAPFGNLQWRARLHALPSTPVNPRCDGCVLIGHGSPPLLNRSNAEVRPVRLVATAPVAVTGMVPVTFHAKAQGGCQGINPSVPVPGVPYVPSSCSASMARHHDEDRISKKDGAAICRIKHPAKTACLYGGGASGDHAAVS